MKYPYTVYVRCKYHKKQIYLKEDKKVEKNYEKPELKVWENEELDVIRTSFIGHESNKDNGADDIGWTDGWDS